MLFNDSLNNLSFIVLLKIIRIRLKSLSLLYYPVECVIKLYSIFAKQVWLLMTHTQTGTCIGESSNFLMGIHKDFWWPFNLWTFINKSMFWIIAYSQNSCSLLFKALWQFPPEAAAIKLDVASLGIIIKGQSQVKLIFISSRFNTYLPWIFENEAGILIDFTLISISYFQISIFERDNWRRDI